MGSSPRKPVKCRQTFLTRKLMATVFWDKKGIILVEFMERGTTINAAVYSDTLKKLRSAIQNRRRGMFTLGIVLLHDNVRPHTAARTQVLLNSFGWDIFEHSPQQSRFGGQRFSPFSWYEEMAGMGSRRFTDDEELKNSVSGWLRAQAADFYAEGIEKLVTRYDKCLNNCGNYVEK
uniref:Mariner Mos1 transposase n=1 Tax=Clastoptera arizonana TaxID=38151 RepID=A0A1B6CWX6_9HEMI